MYIFASTFVLILIAFGFYFRKKTKLHALFMSLAFVIDISLVLMIELNRGAIDHVLGTSSLFIWFHVLVSVSVIILYLLQMYIGINLAKNLINNDLRKTHKILAYIFVILRLINYVTSFSMPEMV